MLAGADSEAVGLVTKGRSNGLARGWMYVGGNLFQSDRASETTTRAALQAGAAPGSEITFTAVPRDSEKRIGIDRDQDGALDRDELDRRSDPADPTGRPKLRRVPARKNPVREVPVHEVPGRP